MNNYNKQFLSTYNALDSFLKKITGNRNINMISVYEKTMPPRLSAEMKTVRKYKNELVSHPSLPGGAEVLVPKEWYHWIERQYNYCQKNKDIVKSNLMRELDKQEQFRQNKLKKYINQEIKKRERKLSENAQIIKRELLKNHNFPAKKYSELENAFENYLRKQPRDKLKFYKKVYNIKMFSKESSCEEIAKEEVCRLSDYEREYLLGKKK